jgi:preprotein translocase subunit SecB
VGRSYIYIVNLKQGGVFKIIKTPENYCTVTVRTGILQGDLKKVQHFGS